MIIHESFGIDDPKRVSTNVREGVILISNVAPFIDNMRFSWMDLQLMKELKNQVLDIDFDKWLTLLKKEQELKYIFTVVTALRQTLAYEASLNDENEMSFCFQSKFGCESEDPVADFYRIIEEGKSHVTKFMKFDKNNDWKIREEDLVNTVEGVELKISKEKKEEIFKMIAEHVNQHLDNGLERIDNLLSANRFWSALHNKSNQEKIVSFFREEEESDGEDLEIIRERASEALEEIFGLKVSVW